MLTEPDWNGIKRRLDMIVLLLLESGPSGATSTTQKIEKLLEFGLTMPEVAQIIGKKTNYVSAVASSKRKVKMPKGDAA